jgi:tetratricopeptide (TPR) repeat protein
MKTATATTIFISRAHADRALAVRIAEILRGAGYKTILQDEDFLHTSFMEQMDAALRSGARVVALLSRAYEESEHCRAEWQAAIADDPLNLKQRLVIFRVGEHRPGGLLRALVYSDLVPVGDDVAALTRIVRDAVARGEVAEPDTVAATIVDPDALWEVPSFTGREQALTDLRDTLFGRTGMAAVTQPAAVYGMGGVGKSALAREYAWRNRGDYSVLWWLNAETEDGIIGGLIRLGSRFIPGLDQEQDRTKAAKLALERVFASLHKPALFVFDNIENQALLRKWKPRENCHVLVTSRLHGWGGGFTSVEIKQWPPKDARDYLTRESGRTDIGEGDADGIANVLGYLPLALAHAAAVLRDNPAMTVKSYLERIEILLDRAPSGAEYDRAVYATFQDALAQAEKRAPGAAAILCLAAFYAPDDIPFELFEQAPEIYSDSLAPIFDEGAGIVPLRTAVADPQLREEAFSALGSVSLVALNLNTLDFSVHRLVQAASRDLAGAMHAGWAETAITAIEAVYPSGRFGTWPVCEKLAPHGEAVASYSSDLSNRNLALLLNRIGYYFRQRAFNSRAEPLYRRALAINENAYGPDHPAVATVLNNLALLLHDTARVAQAEPLMRRVLFIDEKNYGSDHPEVAIDLGNLARLLHTTKRYAEAEPLMRRALEIDEKGLGPDHPNVARDLNNLAQLLIETNRREGVEQLMRRALAIDEKSSGPYHPEVAIDLSNLARLLLQTNRLVEAVPKFERAADIFRAAFGDDHPNVRTAEKDVEAARRILKAQTRP